MKTDFDQKNWISAVAVHTGSRNGDSLIYAPNAADLGRKLAENDFTIYYGDGSAGTMGVMARRAIDAGGAVHGVTLPFFLKAQGDIIPGAKESKIVRTMHERITYMRENSQVNAVLPGSYGTMEEGFEWLSVVNGHIKPQLLINYKGFWNGYAGFLDEMVDRGLEPESLKDRFTLVASPDHAMEKIEECNANPARADQYEPIRMDLLSSVQKTRHATIVNHAPLRVIAPLFSQAVAYDISNIPGQTVFNDPDNIIRPYIFTSKDGFYDPLKEQLEIILKTKFSPEERRKLFHFVASEGDAKDLAHELSKQDPLTPDSFKKKHAEFQGDKNLKPQMAA